MGRRGPALSRTDPLGRTTRWSYDGAGNLAALTRPDGTAVRVDYDQRRLLVSPVEADGARWQWAYDAAGNLRTATEPAGGTTSYG